MPAAVFVERELTARKGKKRTKLHLRVYAPVPHGAEFACSFELTSDGPPTWGIPKQLYGYDGLQAFTLAMQFAGLTLLHFEAEHGMRIDPWHWWNLVEFVAEMPVSTHDRDRINQIKGELRELLNKDGQAAQGSRKASTASRNRKQRASSPKPRAVTSSRKRSTAGRKP